MTRRRNRKLLKFVIAIGVAALAGMLLPTTAHAASGKFVFNINDDERVLRNPPNGTCIPLHHSTRAIVNGTDQQATVFSDASCQTGGTTLAPGGMLVAQAAAVKFGGR